MTSLLADATIGAVEDAVLDEHWETAFRTDSHATPFQSPAWRRAWSRVVAPVERQRPLLWRSPSRGEIRLTLAFQLGKDVHETSTLSPLGAPWIDYQDEIDAGASEADLDAAARWIAEVLKSNGARLECSDVRPGGTLERVLRRLGPPSGSSSICSAIDLGECGHVERLLDRKEHALKRRRLARLGALSQRHICRPDAVGPALDRFIELHRRQWEGRADAVASFIDPGVETGFRALADELSKANLLLVTEVLLDVTVLASYFGLMHRGVYYAYRTAFDHDYFRYSPGHLLLQALIRKGLEAGWSQIDFMRGDYAYKRDYATSTQRNLAWIQGA